MFIKIQGRKIWYRESGKGQALILIHGHLESSEVWNRFAERLNPYFRVISPDLPGHGQSDVYSETHTVEMMAGIIKDLLDKLEIKRAFMVGHSLGGYVTLAFLELYPEYLSGYCLFHSHPLADTPETIEKRKNEINIVMSGKKDKMVPDNVEKMFAPMNLDKFKEEVKNSKSIASGLPGNGIIAVLNGMMKRPSRLKLMEEGKIPCLWILGSHDNYIPCNDIQKKVRLPGNAKIAVLKNSGHMGFVEEEEHSAGLLKDFISGLSAW